MSGYNPYAAGHGHAGDGLHPMEMSANAAMMGQGSAMDTMAGQSLDDIVNQNAKLMRRHSMGQVYHSQNQQQQQQQRPQQPQQPLPSQQNMDTDDPRRMSMMEFTGTSPSGPLDAFQFNLQNSGMVDATAYMASQPNPSLQPSRRQSANNGEMALDNGFSANSYMPMMPHTSSYQSPAHIPNLDMNLNSPYMTTPMNMSSMGYNSPNVDQPMPMYNHTPYHPGMMNSPINTSVPNHMYATSSENGGNPKRPSLENTQSRSSNSQGMQQSHSQSRHPTPQRQNSRAQPNNQKQHSGSGFRAQPQNPVPGSRDDIGMDRGRSHQTDNNNNNNGDLPPPDPTKYNPNNQGFSWPTPEGLFPPYLLSVSRKLISAQADGHPQ